LSFSITTRKQFPNSPLAHQQLLKTPLKLFPLFFITSSKLWEYSWHPFHPFEFPGTQLRVQQTLGSIGGSDDDFVSCLLSWNGIKNSRQTPRRRRLLCIRGLWFLVSSWSWSVRNGPLHPR